MQIQPYLFFDGRCEEAAEFYRGALGAKVARPERAVVALTGDGGFMYNVQELATAVHHGISVVAIVFNNSSFGNVLRDQRQAYQGRYIGADLTNPDFVRLGESFGVHSRRATSPTELRGLLEGALSLEVPALIEVPVEKGSEASPWPFLHPAAPEA